MEAGPLLGIAAGAVVLILVLVIWMRLHAFLVLVVVSALTAIATRVPMDQIITTLLGGFGSTLASVALVVGLGAIIGRLIESSGGAQVVADRMVDVFGEKRAAFALGLTALFLGFPIFFDAGLVVMLPVIFAIARRMGGKNLLLYGISAAGAFSVMHAFVPPHPGPVAAGEFFGASIGVVLIVGAVVAVPLWYFSGYLWAKSVNRRFPMPVPALFAPADDDDLPKTPPGFGTVVLILMLPLLLILLNTGLNSLGSGGVVDLDAGWVQSLMFVGTAPIALLITALIAMLVLGRFRGESGSALEKLVDGTFGPVASVILITGAGGMFGGVLRASGIGDALAGSLADLGLPLIFATYVAAALLKIAQGSATVALVTTGGLMATAVAAVDHTPLQLACFVLAAAAGSIIASHVNDSGFWLVGKLFGMDVKTTLKVWTVQSTLESVIGFVLVLGIYYGLGWIGS